MLGIGCETLNPPKPKDSSELHVDEPDPQSLKHEYSSKSDCDQYHRLLRHTPDRSLVA